LPKNDDGEFELVLGNRQLISVFVIVVVLLAVFFSMGYIVGRNSQPAETARNEKPKGESDSSTNPDTTPPEASTPPPSESSTPPASEPAPEATKPESTKPAQATPPPAPPKPEPVRKETPKPSPVTSPPKPSASSEPVHAAAAGEPSSGQYWQVVATARPDAEIIAEALGKKGFHVVLAPAPKDGIFRVLVGPLRDAATQAQIRTGLESAGFKNPILRKY